MNKYNTIEQKEADQGEEESTHPKVLTNRIARATLLHGDHLEKYISSER